jgi:hypothetical protein
MVSKTRVFDTGRRLHHFPEQQSYRLVSKLVSQSKYQNLTNVMSFDTIVV